MALLAIICFSFLVHFSNCFHQYNDSSNIYFEYKSLDFENCQPATECVLDFVQLNTTEDLQICTLDETISSPLCPLSWKDNVCVCVKENDCPVIHNIFLSQNQSLIRKVNQSLQACGFEGTSPKYCCPYRASLDSACHLDNKFPCLYFNQCYEKDLLCDANQDCLDGTDEEFCSESNCKGFLCNDREDLE